MSDAPRDLSVLVFDDESNSAEDLRGRLAEIEGLRVTCLTDPGQELRLLEERRRAARSGGAQPDGASAFDDVDILVVDYDLAAESESATTAAETGERVAYLVRCYSTCGYIVGLNQFANSPVFDLTLTGNPRSFADLNISNEEVDHPALWGQGLLGYQPWWWPNLREAPAALRRRASILSTEVAIELLTLLGLDDDRVRIQLTRNQSAWLTSSGPLGGFRPTDVLKGRLGLRPKDELASDGDRARVAAARITKWVERVLIPGQHITIDAPHLLTRYPSLATTAELARADLRSKSPETYMDVDKLAGAALPRSWYPMQCWLWPLLIDQEDIEENADPFADSPDIGNFCEDVSRFLPRQHTRAFASDFDPFSRRFVANPPPEDALRQGPWGLNRVVYEPSVAFAIPVAGNA